MLKLWKLMDFAPGEGRETGVFKPEFDDAAWLDIPVPGDVHRVLMAAGRIPDPFYDRNEGEAAWMEQREFWYRARFKATGGAPGDDERVLLVFHGLDTFCVLYLNGELLGRSENMFTEAVFDVSRKLKWGRENVIAVRFDPPLKHVDPNDPFKSTWGGTPERVYMRKAQFGYGWDWGPRLPTIGMWRPAEIVRHKVAALLGTQFATLRLSGSPNSALVMVRVEASRFDSAAAASASSGKAASAANSGQLKAEIRLSEPGQKKPVLEETLLLDRPGSLQDATGYFTVANPRLWWTHDLLPDDLLDSQADSPFLYDLRVTLRRGKEVLEVSEQKVGIRTLTLDQSPDPDEPGTRFFRFMLNGVPIFAKGANWIPADSFVGAIPNERYETLLQMARSGNMNMLRVWGGGIYEHEIFYDLCDRLGILVWQDFMFSCAMYPENNNRFIVSVDSEARYQVRRLRSHASLAVWCGNNENQWLHDQQNADTPGQKVPGTLYYDHILPAAVADLDGVTPYWPSSPYGGSDYNSMEDGDRHNWWVWHGGHSRRFGDPVVEDHTPEGVSHRHYAEDSGRFISEFGMHAAPVYETLRRVIPEDQLALHDPLVGHHSPSMDHHNKDNPKNKGDNLMATVTGLPVDLAEYIDYSMIAQAEGLKFGIEHFRRRKPHCSGALIWQLNDCWPVLSWSLIDYYGFRKAGYFYTRRVFADVLASFKEEPAGGVSLWITNDLLAELVQTVTVRLSGFDGGPVWEQPVKVEVGPNSSRAVAHWSAEQLRGPDGAGADLSGCYLSVRSPDGAFTANRHFFAAIKDLRRTVVEPTISFRAVSDGVVEVELSAPGGYVYFVHLTHPSEHTRYSDNYFDLEPGETRTIRVWNEREALVQHQFGIGWR